MIQDRKIWFRLKDIAKDQEKFKIEQAIGGTLGHHPYIVAHNLTYRTRIQVKTNLK